jgi:hypothetical protein
MVKRSEGMLERPARLVTVNGPPLISLAMAEGNVSLVACGLIGAMTNVPVLFWAKAETGKSKNRIMYFIIGLRY